MNIYQKFRRKNNVSFKPESSYQEKAVQGTFHQENTRFGETAGIKCTSNAYFAIIFSAMKKVSLWKTNEINYILDKGDMLLKSLGINQPLAFDELPHVVNIEGYNIHTDFFYDKVIYLSIPITFLNILGI